MLGNAKSFAEAWAPQYEETTNRRGDVCERGARALLKKEAKKAEMLKRIASGEEAPLRGEMQELRFQNILKTPGAGFSRLSFALQGPLKDRCDYVSIGRKLLLTDVLPQGEIYTSLVTHSNAGKSLEPQVPETVTILWIGQSAGRYRPQRLNFA